MVLAPLETTVRLDLNEKVSQRQVTDSNHYTYGNEVQQSACQNASGLELYSLEITRV